MLRYSTLLIFMGFLAVQGARLPGDGTLLQDIINTYNVEFTPEPGSFLDCLHMCFAMGGTLVQKTLSPGVSKNYTSLELVYERMLATGELVWIGASSNAPEGPWWYMDGGQFPPENPTGLLAGWAPKNPVGNCALLSIQGYLHNHDCDNLYFKYYGLCEIPVKTDSQFYGKP